MAASPDGFREHFTVMNSPYLALVVQVRQWRRTLHSVPQPLFPRLLLGWRPLLILAALVSGMLGPGPASAAATPENGLYWAPGRPAQLYAIEHQEDRVVLVVMSYDEAGRAEWFTASGPLTPGMLIGTPGHDVADAAYLNAPLYRLSGGPPLDFRQQLPSFVPFSTATSIGTVTLEFYGHGKVWLDLRYNEQLVRSVLTRFNCLPKAEIDDLVDNKRNPGTPDHLVQLIRKYGEHLYSFPNHLSVHAGGILISEKPITCYTALNNPPKGFPLTQFSMLEAEDVGLYKFDILAQRGVGKIRDAVTIIQNNQQVSIDIRNVQQFKEDPAIRKNLKEARLVGCFYVESPAMRMLLTKLQAETYLDLVAASSIIRPGVASSGMMREYILRSRGMKPSYQTPQAINEILHEAPAFDAAALVGYNTPLNALRVCKGFVLAFALIPYLHLAIRRVGQAGLDRLTICLTLGLTTCSLAALWERLAFPGLTDFATDYRTTALFWESHVGGAGLDAWLLLSMPFADQLLQQTRQTAGKILALLLVGIGSYALFSTLSRIVYGALPVAVVTGGGLLLLRPARPTEVPRRTLVLAALLAATLLAAALIFREGGYRGLLAFFGLALLVYPGGDALSGMRTVWASPPMPVAASS